MRAKAFMLRLLGNEDAQDSNVEAAKDHDWYCVSGKSRADPLECQIERSLMPGAFISDGGCYEFVSRLEGVKERIDALLDSDAARSVTLCESLLAGCYQKAEELDDSSGSLGQFVDELFSAWIKARQAARSDPDDTAAKLLKWMDADEYGFCSQLEVSAAEALDQTGLAAFERLIRARFEAAATASAAGGGAARQHPEYLRRRWGEALRTIYLAQRDVAAYVALAEETGLTAKDCHALGALLSSSGKHAEALVWVERGIAVAERDKRGSMAGYDLATLRRELLVQLWRGEEALQAAWTEYQAAPSKYAYTDLMKFVPEAERTAWHERALDAAMGADLHVQIELFLETGENARLVELLHRSREEALEAVSHFTTEPAAQKLEETHPETAARLWRAQGMRIVNAKKSKYYDTALANFERAMRCFEQAGAQAEREETVARIRAEHRRKIRFIAGFEALIAGQGLRGQPSYLERAKARFLADRTEDV